MFEDTSDTSSESSMSSVSSPLLEDDNSDENSFEDSLDLDMNDGQRLFDFENDEMQKVGDE